MRSGRASATAAWIARGVVGLGAHPIGARVLPPGLAATTAAVLESAGVLPRWQRSVITAAWFHRGLDAVEPVVGRGLLVYLALRKRAVHDEVRAALSDGARQVLVLGAGLDGLCAYLAPELGSVRFVEVDHPDTQRLKRGALQAAGMTRPGLHLVEADLAQRDLAAVMGQVPGWDPTGAAVVVVEGVLMYLDEAAVRGLFQAITRCCGPGTRVVFTWIPRDLRGRVGRSLGAPLRTSLVVLGERARWGPRPGGLGGFLSELDFELIGPESLELAARYLEPLGLDVPVADAERVAVARRR